jgi:ribulose 1,5-bisphosphate carboxylase large subunit-like protein
MVKEFAFIDQGYKPTSNDLICLFKVTPDGMSLNEAINNVALESSVGTWTPVSSNLKREPPRLWRNVIRLLRRLVKRRGI